MPASVGFLSVVQPGRLPGHTAFLNAMAADNIHVELKTPRINGYYGHQGSELTASAQALTTMNLCAIVAADSCSAIELIRARTPANHPPIVISVPSNKALEQAINTATGGSGNIYIAHPPEVGEPQALAWFLADALRQAALFDIGDNVIVMIGNKENPGSQREATDTVAWFAHYFGGGPRRVTVESKPVECLSVPAGSPPANANGLYNINAVLGEVTLMRTVQHRNVKALMGLGDPTSNFYRDPIKSYLANWQPPIATAWESWYGLFNGGFICWAGNRKQAWDQVTAKVRELCQNAPDPEMDEIQYALVGNAATAEQLGIKPSEVNELCSIEIQWLPQVPELQPPDLHYAHYRPRPPEPPS